MLTAFGVMFSRFTPRLIARLLAVVTAALATLFVVQAPTATAAPTGFVHRQGTSLVDGLNRPLLMNSVNIGGYLMWEGWIFGGGLTAETPILDKFRRVYGETAPNDPKTKSFQNRIRDNFVTRADFSAMKDAGVNTVRVPINHRLTSAQNDGFRTLDRLVADAKAVGLYLVFDLHGAPGGQSKGFIADPDPSSNNEPAPLWRDTANQDATVAWWRATAARYAGETTIAGYDLINEPDAPQMSDLTSLYTRITAAIRQVDANHMLIYEGNDYSHTFDGLTRFDNNMSLSFHQYPSESFQQARLAGYKAYANKPELQVPVWNGEYGLDEMGAGEQIDRFNAANIAGQAMWTWKTADVDYAFFSQRTGKNPTPRKIKVLKAAGQTGYTWEDMVQYLTLIAKPVPTTAQADAAVNEFITNIQLARTTENTTMTGILKRGCKVSSSANCA